jgi:hypothetical protein
MNTDKTKLYIRVYLRSSAARVFVPLHPRLIADPHVTSVFFF